MNSFVEAFDFSFFRDSDRYELVHDFQDAVGNCVSIYGGERHGEELNEKLVGIAFEQAADAVDVLKGENSDKYRA